MAGLTGQCMCGQVTWTSEVEPLAMAVCHCIPCRRTSSTSASNNLIIPRDKFKTTGTLKQFTRKGDSGKNVTYNFCTTCPSIVFVDVETQPTNWIVKAGTCTDDSFLSGKTADAEIYVKNRYSWVRPTEAPEKEEQ